MRSIAVIPVKGRLPLLKYTIRRLYNKNGVDHVICIGDDDSEKSLCHQEGAEFIYHENKPLGRKWNAGFLKAKEYKPEYVVYVGSSDWLSDNWLTVLNPFIEKFYMVGKRDFYLYHIGVRDRLALWPHYPQLTKLENLIGKRDRFDEPIGIGRLLKSDFLDEINWMPFHDTWDVGMDGIMWNKLFLLQRTKADTIQELAEKNPQYLCGVVALDNIKSLSVSCDLWSNLHSKDFEAGHVIHLDNIRDIWLAEHFPEAIELKAELCQKT